MKFDKFRIDSLASDMAPCGSILGTISLYQKSLWFGRLGLTVWGACGVLFDCGSSLCICPSATEILTDHIIVNFTTVFNVPK